MKVYQIDEDIELIVRNPHSQEHQMPIIVDMLQTIDRHKLILSGYYCGNLNLKISGIYYQINYEFWIKRVLSSLEAYSSAIQYIKMNMYLYDPILFDVALEELEKRFRNSLSYE